MERPFRPPLPIIRKLCLRPKSGWMPDFMGKMPVPPKENGAMKASRRFLKGLFTSCAAALT
jgi:hypothetical protein